MNIELLIPVFVAIVAAFPGLIALRGQSKKVNADVMAIQEQVAQQRWERVKDDIQELESELSLLRGQLETANVEIATLRERVRLLETENQELRHENANLKRGRQL